MVLPGIPHHVTQRGNRLEFGGFRTCHHNFASARLRSLTHGAILAVAILGLTAFAAPTSYLSARVTPGAAGPKIQALARCAKSGDSARAGCPGGASAQNAAQLALGIAYADGHGLSVDVKRAREFHHFASTPNKGTVHADTPAARPGETVYVASWTIVPPVEALLQTRQKISANEPLLLLDEFKPCEDCPVFVKVPTSPSSLRDIKYVSKFELTWRNYLASYRDGTCKMPSQLLPQKSGNHVTFDIAKYTIDWPIGVLGPSEIECYSKWIRTKVGLSVSLPSESEWEWFARAGNTSAKYPWGSEVDGRREALEWSPSYLRSSRPYPDATDGKYVPQFVSGLKVGLFPPNAWNIHDLMGNLPEITNNRVSGEDLLAKDPSNAFLKATKNYPRSVIKGNPIWAPTWTAGISQKHYVIEYGTRFSAQTAVRFVLFKDRSIL